MNKNKKKRILGEVGKIKELTKKLEKCQEINKLKRKKEPESWTLSYSLSEIEESFLCIFDKKLPLLMKDNIKKENIIDILSDIREELRHIVYHIEDSEYLSSILE